jgi:hypothetical protein
MTNRPQNEATANVPVRGIDHVGVAVPDLEAASDFLAKE